MINITKIFIDKKTEDEVKKVLLSGFLAQGERVKELERQLCDINRTKYAAVVNSGTAALHTALASLGLKKGDEVITTPFSFIATANTILMCNAKPVFVDIKEGTFNIDPDLIEAKISKKTKAILTVDLYGLSCDYEKIRRIARKHNLKVISDSCQAIGASYMKKPIAKWVDVACFSFYATKNIMMGEGGALVTDNNEIYEFARRFRQHGQDQEKPYIYHHIGYNYRSTDVLASIGLAQIGNLKQWTEKRNQNARRLVTKLKNIPGLVLPESTDGTAHAYHQFTVRITGDFPIKRAELIKYLLENGVRSAVYYPSVIPMQPHIKKITPYKKGMYPVAETLSNQVLSLPVHPFLKNSEIDLMVSLIKKAAK